jgi:hypothetical protein
MHFMQTQNEMGAEGDVPSAPLFVIAAARWLIPV